MKTFAVLAGMLLLMLVLPCGTAVAAPGLAAVTMAPASGGGETWSVSIQVLAMMTALSLLPAALISMTSFTRIIIVLAILRQALGTAQTPSNQILIGLSLFLTLFVMSPVFGKIYDESLKPYLDEQITTEQALAQGQQVTHQVAAVHGRDIGRRQGLQRLGVVPVVEVAPVAL